MAEAAVGVLHTSTTTGRDELAASNTLQQRRLHRNSKHLPLHSTTSNVDDAHSDLYVPVVGYGEQNLPTRHNLRSPKHHPRRQDHHLKRNNHSGRPTTDWAWSCCDDFPGEILYGRRGLRDKVAVDASASREHRDANSIEGFQTSV